MIHQGDCREILPTFAADGIDCIVTSPPYFGLRDYGAEGQIGLEENLQDYIDTLVTVFRECHRVLKPTGTLWVNLGDSYTRSDKGIGSAPKNLIGIPWRVAFALQSDGWILRQDIIWAKTNPMPEPAGRYRRFVKSHEYVFLLTKSPHYYWDEEATKEPAAGFNDRPPQGSLGTLGPKNSGRRAKGNSVTFRGGSYTNNNAFQNSALVTRTSQGNKPNETWLRYRRDVWNLPTSASDQLRTKSEVKHFATFPQALVNLCIATGCPPNGVVMDPFSGSGTTGMVAHELGRQYIGIELNSEYIEIAKLRISPSIQTTIDMPQFVRRDCQD